MSSIYSYRMNRFLGFAVLFMLAGLVSGCRTTSVKGEPFLNMEGLSHHPSRTLAVLPAIADDNFDELARRLRESFFREISVMPYDDQELRQVDSALAKIAARREKLPAELTLEEMIHPEVADIVVDIELLDVRRLYLLLYAHNRIDLDFKMIDTRTRQVFYENQFRIYDRLTSPGVSPVGFLIAIVRSITFLRAKNVGDSLDRGARQIVAELPTPKIMAAGGHTLRLYDVEVKTPEQVLQVGDEIHVLATGTPACFARFSIGNIVRDEPMTEIFHGTYRGTFTVPEGWDTPFAIVEVELESPTSGEVIVYNTVDQPFAVDTRPPQRPYVHGAWVGDHPQVFLGLGQRTKSEQGIHLIFHPTEDGEPPARYQVFRRELHEKKPKGEFEMLVDTEQLIYFDRDVKPGKTYEYYIAAVDRAGHRSTPGNVIRITVDE